MSKEKTGKRSCSAIRGTKQVTRSIPDVECGVLGRRRNNGRWCRSTEGIRRHTSMTSISTAANTHQTGSMNAEFESYQRTPSRDMHKRSLLRSPWSWGGQTHRFRFRSCLHSDRNRHSTVHLEKCSGHPNGCCPKRECRLLKWWLRGDG